jgi:hypothetical protein
MGKIRLKHNVIGSDGKLIKRGSVIDEQQLPLHLRTEQLIDHDVSGREGKVLLLHGVTFCSDQIDHTGQRVGYPITLAAGELLRLEEVPPQASALG